MTIDTGDVLIGEIEDLQGGNVDERNRMLKSNNCYN